MVTGTYLREVAQALNAGSTRLSELAPHGVLGSTVELATRQQIARPWQEGAGLLYLLGSEHTAQLGPHFLTRQADALLEQAARIVDGRPVVGEAIRQADDAASFLRRRAMYIADAPNPDQILARLTY